jgi:regulatory protein
VPTVTDIKPQKNGKRVNVYLDGKFAFGIDLVNLITAKVKIGSEFAQEKIDSIIKTAELQKVGDRLVEYATLRPRSNKEIKDYLKRKKVPEVLFEGLMLRLKRIGVGGDLEFAKWWVGQRMEFRAKSKRELISELRKKGISSEIISEVLSETDLDEAGSAQKLIDKLAYKWQNLPPNERKKKMGEYLARKGYPWEIIEKIASEE